MADAKSVTGPLPGVVSYFSVDGAKKAPEFYAKAFGATEVRRQPAERTASGRCTARWK